MKNLLFALTVGVLLQACGGEPSGKAAMDYFDNSERADVLSGGVRLIPVETPAGTFRVWTKRVGNNPTMKVLLLHGGPGATHEYLEAFDSYLPGAGIEYYYYDQLGSAYSDQPDTPELWELPRFVDEVEQVRKALEDICRYFEKHEPSSPVPLLLRRAQRLVSKNFLEVIADFCPDAMNQIEKISGTTDSIDSGQVSQ